MDKKIDHVIPLPTVAIMETIIKTVENGGGIIVCEEGFAPLQYPNSQRFGQAYIMACAIMKKPPLLVKIESSDDNDIDNLKS